MINPSVKGGEEELGQDVAGRVVKFSPVKPAASARRAAAMKSWRM